jgi:hypothetical protein
MAVFPGNFEQATALRERARTSAMAAGLTDHRWRVPELLSTPLMVDACA